MLILSIDTTGGACSAALCENRRVVCEAYLHNRLTHSQSLMPLIEDCLTRAGRTVAELDGFAVSVGPGSFTGVRIGICAVKGLAQVTGKPVAAIDTLELLAQGAAAAEGVVCPILDARRGQVYTAFFRNGERLCEDFADAIEVVAEKLGGQKVLFVGDGVPVLREKILGLLPEARFAPEHLNYQRAGFAAALAEDILQNGGGKTAEELLPNYLRDSQAERMKKGNSHA